MPHDNQPRFLAIDMGAESSRAIVGTLTGDKINLEELHRFPSRNIEILGTRYWDILYIFGEIKKALREYAIKYGPKLDGIGVDTWGVDFALLSESGAMVQNPVHYRDHRTDDVLEKAFEVVPRDEIYAKTGIQFMTFNSLFQMWVMKQTTPELFDTGTTFLMIPHLLHYFLTGEKVCEYTNASTTQMLDVEKRVWCDELLERFGIPADKLPKVVEPGSVVGPVKKDILEEVGLEPCNVIAPCTHDTAAAVVAAPAKGSNWAYLSCGTWSLLGMELDKPLTGGKAPIYNFTNEGGFGHTIRFLKNIIGLWILQQSRAAWAKQGQEYEYAELAELAAQAPAFATLIDVNDDMFINPDNMLEAIAEHCKQNGRNVPEGVGPTVRAILEGLAIRYAIVVDQLEELTGTHIETLHMIGGGIQNELLCQFTADAIGRTVIAGPVEATAMGNIMSQAIGVGKIKDLATARDMVTRSETMKTYAPQDVEQWREMVEKMT